MKKLCKAVAMILVMAIALLSVSAVLAEETASQPIVVDAPVVSAPEPEPVVVEAPKPAPAAAETVAPVENATPEATAETEATPAPTESAAPEASETPVESATPEASTTPETSVAPQESTDPEASLVPEASETPVAETTVEPLPTEEPGIDLSNVTINIRCLNGSEARVGDTITLVAEISGLDGVAYGMQWQYQSGGEWHDMGGANDATYQYTLTEKNASYAWRMALTV